MSRFRGFHHVSLFSLQYIGTMRAKRVRNMVLIVTGIFIFDAYLYALMPNDGSGVNWQSSTILYVMGIVLMPSLCLSQWTFGVEANFFQGLMTKPVKIEQMLRNCFYFYMIVSAIALLFTIPLIWMNVGVTVFSLIGAYGMTVFLSLFNLPTCLFSTRLEIFGSSMFNMQGANLKINLYAVAFLVPLAALAAEYIYIGEMAWCITSVVLALVSLAIHKKAIAKLASVFYKRRYKRMETFMEK